jgi:succinate-semialdehyde dehydrogenase/glutarate-semialdehyde dehydrogenase
MKMQINGKAVESFSGEFFDIINPATGELIDRVPRGTKDDAAIAVEAASSAAASWASISSQQRARVFYRAVEIIRQRKDALSFLLTREQGKPLLEAKNEIEGFAGVLEYYCGLASSSHGDFFTVPQNGYAITVKASGSMCSYNSMEYAGSYYGLENRTCPDFREYSCAETCKQYSSYEPHPCVYPE